MSVIGNSLWTDAGNYGAGLGQVLSQAMLQMPHQRAMLAMQQAQQQMEQQRMMQQNQLQQQAQQQSMQLGLGEMALKKQELQQNEQAHQLQLEEQKIRNQLASRGTFKFGQTKEGLPYKMNTITGDFSYLPTSQEGGGTNQPNMGQLAPPTQNQGLERLTGLLNIAARMRAAGAETNSMAPQYNIATNALAGLGRQLPVGVPQMGVTNQPPVASTNQPYKIIQMGQ